jgi:ABC-type transporter Mla subunit MlaD
MRGDHRRPVRVTRSVAGAMAAVLGLGLIAVVGPAEAATWTSTYTVSATGWSGQEPVVGCLHNDVTDLVTGAG